MEIAVVLVAVFRVVEDVLAAVEPVEDGNMRSRSLNPFLFFSVHEKTAIINAIEIAEQKTSGEIRVHLEKKIHQNILEDAKQTFEKIGMTKTELKNGVLIFLAVYDHQFAILGDSGIHEKVQSDFWQETQHVLETHFKKNDFVNGIMGTVGKIGEKLALYFPKKDGDKNELADQISYGK